MRDAVVMAPMPCILELPHRPPQFASAAALLQYASTMGAVVASVAAATMAMTAAAPRASGASICGAVVMAVRGLKIKAALSTGRTGVGCRGGGYRAKLVLYDSCCGRVSGLGGSLGGRWRRWL